MKFRLHRLYSGLYVLPAVPRRLMMYRVHLMDVGNVNGVDLMHRRSLLPRGRRGRRGRRRARHRIELVMAVDAAGVHGVLYVRMTHLGLILKLEPATHQGRRGRPVGRRSPFGDRAAASRALILLRGVFTAKTGAARPALGRGLQVGRSRELRRRSGMSGVPRRQPRSWSSGRLRRRRRRQRLDGHEPPGLGVDRLERW